MQDRSATGEHGSERSVQVTRLFREILSPFAQPELVDAVMREALRHAGHACLARTADGLREFAAVDLHRAVARALGLDVAEAVASSIEPMLVVLARTDGDQTHASGVATPANDPYPSGPRPITRVALVTEDPWLALRVGTGLGDAIELEHYASLGEFGRHGRNHASIIVDCRSFQGSSGLAASAADAVDALTRTDVLLLHAGMSERSALRNACPGVGVILCSMSVSREVIADFIGMNGGIAQGARSRAA